MKVLVIGATGKQGGQVARLLLSKGHEVRAFTRKPDSPEAHQLAALGALIATGDLEDPSSVERAARGVEVLFAMATPYEAGAEAETRQGINIADAAKSSTGYLVYNSVANADKKTGIPHFDSKWKVEEHIRKIGMDCAVIAPVYFMENLLARGIEGLKKGVYSSPLAADRKLQQIAVADVAAMSALAIENKSRFVGKRIDIAGDDLSGAEEAEILSRVIGRGVKYTRLPMEEMRKISYDWVKMYEWFTRVGYSADIKALHRDYPEVEWHTFEAWASQQDWNALLAPKAEPVAHGI